jgi:hypothetical protein
LSAITLLQDLLFLGAAAVWGVIAVGLFADNPEPLDTTSGRSGLFKGKSQPWVTGQISFHNEIVIHKTQDKT